MFKLFLQCLVSGSSQNASVEAAFSNLSEMHSRNFIWPNWVDAYWLRCFFCTETIWQSDLKWLNYGATHISLTSGFLELHEKDLDLPKLVSEIRLNENF